MDAWTIDSLKRLRKWEIYYNQFIEMITELITVLNIQENKMERRSINNALKITIKEIKLKLKNN